MGATTVQANGGPKYEKTVDPRRMLTHATLSEAIRTDWDVVKRFLPARTATSLRYAKAATKAVAWNEGGSETKIDLPFQDGWYVPDGNPFAIPNGQKSDAENPDALYLYRYQDRSFNGPVGRDGIVFDYRGRGVFADDYWSDASGVALVGREATAPLVGVSKENLVDVADPKALLQRAEQLEAMANDFSQRFKSMLTTETHQRFVTEPLEVATMLRELAGKIEAIQQKA